MISMLLQSTYPRKDRNGQEEAVSEKGGGGKKDLAELVAQGPLLRWNLPICSHPDFRVSLLPNQCPNFNRRVPVRLGIQFVS